jgi:ribosomal-protein-alanine N-acetyltransferase
VVKLREAAGPVAIVAATLETLDAEDRSGADAAALLGVAAPATWPPEFNDAGTREWMRGMIRQHPGEPGYGSWYITGDGRLVGTCGYKGPPDANGEVEIGYAVIESEQRKGYASGAVNLLVDRAFRDPRVTAVTAETIGPLVGSQAVLARCGFRLIASIPNEEYGEILRYARQLPTA